MTLRERVEGLGDGSSVYVVKAFAADEGGQHRRQTNPHTHVASTRTLEIRGKRAWSSDQVSPPSALMPMTPPLVP